jgi:lipoprotein signal peptidase
MRIGDFQLCVCNTADIAITLGVAALLIDALMNDRRASPPASSPDLR